MRIICQQMNSHETSCLFVFSKSSKIWNCRLLQIIGGALWVSSAHCTELSDMQNYTYWNTDLSQRCVNFTIGESRAHTHDFNWHSWSKNYSSTHHFILNYATLLGDYSPFVFNLLIMIPYTVTYIPYTFVEQLFLYKTHSIQSSH